MHLCACVPNRKYLAKCHSYSLVVVSLSLIVVYGSLRSGMFCPFSSCEVGLLSLGEGQPTNMTVDVNPIIGWYQEAPIGSASSITELEKNLCFSYFFMLTFGLALDFQDWTVLCYSWFRWKKWGGHHLEWEKFDRKVPGIFSTSEFSCQ